MSRILVTGHRGLVGSALVRALDARGDEVLTVDRSAVDLTDRSAVRSWFQTHRPETVIHAAARVGGIGANMADPVGFLLDNLRIQDVVMTEAVDAGARTTVFLGSSCIYPRETAQPMSEAQLMTGPLEPTNESYAIAKIAGLQLAKALHASSGTRHLCPIPCNVYGPGDHFELDRSHVVSALVRRFVDAQADRADEVQLWGTGVARREFIHCDDLADAVLHLLGTDVGPEPINVGSGIDTPIAELAQIVADLVGFEGRIAFDPTRPDGMPRKLLDVSKLRATGWRPRRSLEEGLKDVIWDYQARRSTVA